MCRTRLVSPEQPVLCIPIRPAHTTVLTITQHNNIETMAVPALLKDRLSMPAWICVLCFREDIAHAKMWLKRIVCHYQRCTSAILHNGRGEIRTAEMHKTKRWDAVQRIPNKGRRIANAMHDLTRCEKQAGTMAIFAVSAAKRTVASVECVTQWRAEEATGEQ